MKTILGVLMALAFVTVASARDKVMVHDFVVQMEGGVGDVHQPCWLHVSDGKTLYVIKAMTYRPWGQNCNEVNIGEHVQGAQDRKYFIVLFPEKGGKTKRREYEIVSMSSAETTQ
jgi:hypothetical protein